MFNTKTKHFEERVIALANESNLPPCVVGLVLDKVRAQVSLLELQARMAEAKENQEPKQEKGE